MAHMIIDKQTAGHYTWGDGCDSWILADAEGLSIKQEHMPPGTKEKLHYHAFAQQFFFILQGTATFYLDTKQAIVTAQQGLLIKPNTQHYIANETQEALEFLVISQPPTDKDRINIE